MAITTAEQLLHAGDIGRCELVRGEFHEMIPPGFEHGGITMKLSAPLAQHVEAHELGTVVAAETGFLLSSDPMYLATRFSVVSQSISPTTETSMGAFLRSRSNHACAEATD